MTDQPKIYRSSNLRRWSGRQRVSRRRFVQAGGLSALGAGAFLIVGCGDDEEEATRPAAAEQPAAEQPAAEQPAAEQPAAEQPAAEQPAAEQPAAAAAARDLIVAQAALMVTLDQEFSVEHETQESQVNQFARLTRNRYIQDEAIGTDRQDVSGLPESFEGELAESWSVSDDGLEYTFKLKPEVVSPAGNILTADDVVYTFERKAGMAAIGAFIAALALSVTTADQVERIDDRTVKFRLPQPFDTFMHGISNAHAGSIVDSTLLKQNATTDDPWAAQWASNHSHGFGAFSLETFDPGKEAIWKTNPNYVHGVPNFERMIWRQIPESATRLSLVQRGDVHIAKQMLAREQETAEGQEGIDIPKARTNLMVFGPLNVRFRPFDDIRVRQAFTYTIPYDEIVNTVYKGRARRMFGILWDPVPGRAPQYWERYNTDITKAKELLAEAGVPDGFETDFGFSLATPDMEEVATLMRDSAAQAGIKMNLVGLTPSQLNDIHNAGAEGIPHIIRDFAIVQTPPYTLGLFATPASPINFAGYESGVDNFDKFWGAMQQAIAVGNDDSPEALALWDEAQKWYAEDAPYFWSNWVDPAWIFRTGIEGYTHRTDNTIDYGRLRFTS